MSETTEVRATAEYIIDKTFAGISAASTMLPPHAHVLAALDEAGYVIVHPDDVPEQIPPRGSFAEGRPGDQRGWSTCRAEVFG
jgi:hypothetical protein